MGDQADNPGGWQIAALAAVGVGLSAVVAVFFTKVRTLLEVLADKFIASVSSGKVSVEGVELLSFIAEFNYILNETRKIEAVTRVVVFIGHNGGGLPKPGSPYIVRSQTGWTVQSGDATFYGTYAFDLEVDQAYCDMLSEVHRTGRTVLTTSEMKPCMLKSIYETEKIVQSLLYSLKLDTKRNRFAYMTIASHLRPFTANELSMIEILVGRLRASFNLNGK